MITKKLLEFQKKNIAISKDGKNPHFKSSYATLNEVLSKVREPLNTAGVLILQQPEKDGLRTTLLDTEDDTKVECFMAYTSEATTAQKLGSNNTYNRRYSLVTLLGLEDSDDDGHVASAPVKKPEPAKKEVVTINLQDLLESSRTMEELAANWQKVPTSEQKKLMSIKEAMKTKLNAAAEVGKFNPK